VTVEPVRTLADELRDQWAARDLDEMASDAVKFLSAGTATDWGMASNVQSSVPPITLGGGIPDPETLPRRELLEAMERALATEDDGPLRYGGGWGYEPLREELAGRAKRPSGGPRPPPPGPGGRPPPRPPPRGASPQDLHNPSADSPSRTDTFGPLPTPAQILERRIPP
jgi:hypothetical protein